MGSTRRRFLGVSAFAVASGFAGCTNATTPQELTVETLDDGVVQVQPRDRPVLLDFFATWCAPCKPQMSDLGEIRARYGPDRLHMLSVTWELDEAAVRGFWEEYRGSWPVAMDPAVTTGEHYGVQNLPTLLVFTPEGDEVWRHVGLAGLSTIEDAISRAGVE
ncbi:TlpA family protein disulfide reductase [Haladaptatus sp. ZSTT2]|uniref:TlpA family protein disulfide reductase n=1 Tax=Haladaptatus sp. ZSTT2 TaxID=3120515 RepID=UPI00300F02EF